MTTHAQTQGDLFIAKLYQPWKAEQTNLANYIS